MILIFVQCPRTPIARHLQLLQGHPGSGSQWSARLLSRAASLVGLRFGRLSNGHVSWSAQNEVDLHLRQDAGG